MELFLVFSELRSLYAHYLTQNLKNLKLPFYLNIVLRLDGSGINLLY